MTEIMHPSWAKAMTPMAEEIAKLGDFLRAENATGRGYLHAFNNVFRAFTRRLD